MGPKLSLSVWLWLALASALAAMTAFSFGVSGRRDWPPLRESSRASAARLSDPQQF